MTRARRELWTFSWVPPFAQGNVKDLRVRWALNEAGADYTVRTLPHNAAREDAYRALQPFGQVPAYRDGTVTLFETGAILLHLARVEPGLAAASPQEEASVAAWTLAALNSIEPRIDNVVMPRLFEPEASWLDDFDTLAQRLAGQRLDDLSTYLGGREWLTDTFSVADIVMATVLRSIDDRPLLAERPVLTGYLGRCLARPTFQTALDAQLSTFAENEPA
ncbi:glutathione S-transferase [Roseivivax marinus]|uniref:glutathione S-transferase family protein n=1 Tax=Roseivivax marinus TaxID=1379903 RepID=UPI0008AF4DD6|nr:glutathione S-transferase family protein [Roseivivax marinus]SEK86046.1 glutathione S-transferase [Roseivivax marinus]